MYDDKRCQLGDGEPKRLTLKQCKQACGIGCSFFLYHPFSPYTENCWLANETQTMAKDCKKTESGWTGYARKTVEWKSIPNRRCKLGDGVEHRQTLEQCKALCPEDKCPFFLYHPNSPHKENCWIANYNNSVKTCYSEGGYTVYHHAWTPVHNKKCDFGDGYATKLSLDECKALCPESDCPFFLYHPNSSVGLNIST